MALTENLAVLVGISLTFTVLCCLGEVIITDSTESITYAEFHSMAASFGHSLPEDGLMGFAIPAKPDSGCSKIQPPPTTQKNISWIAIMSRYGGCTFQDKVRNAMNANFSAAIVYNLESDKVKVPKTIFFGHDDVDSNFIQVIPMGGQDDALIPSVFIGFQSGRELLAHYNYYVNPHVWVVITDDDPFDINTYLLPFAIVVGVCFVIMLGIVIFKCLQDYRRRRRHRLPKSALKKLPIHKFKDGDPFETCCICLDDFEEGDKLRILPCDHGYHSKCIDPWLLKNKRICPQCRKRVFDRATGYSGGDSDSDESTRPPVRSTSERTSLLGSMTGPGRPLSGGTFSASGVTSAIVERLQAAQGASTSSNPSSYLTATNESTNESSRGFLSGARRLRRPRRLRRVYEVLTESTSEESEQEEAGAAGGEPRPNGDTHVESLETFVGLGSEHQEEGESEATNGQQQPQHISAEVHVVHVEQEDDEDEESPHEVPIYHEGDDSSLDQEPHVVVTSSNSPPSHNQGAENV